MAIRATEVSHRCRTTTTRVRSTPTVTPRLSQELPSWVTVPIRSYHPCTRWPTNQFQARVSKPWNRSTSLPRPSMSGSITARPTATMPSKDMIGRTPNGSSPPELDCGDDCSLVWPVGARMAMRAPANAISSKPMGSNAIASIGNLRYAADSVRDSGLGGRSVHDDHQPRGRVYGARTIVQLTPLLATTSATADRPPYVPAPAAPPESAVSAEMCAVLVPKLLALDTTPPGAVHAVVRPLSAQ